MKSWEKRRTTWPFSAYETYVILSIVDIAIYSKQWTIHYLHKRSRLAWLPSSSCPPGVSCSKTRAGGTPARIRASIGVQATPRDTPGRTSSLDPPCQTAAMPPTAVPHPSWGCHARGAAPAAGPPWSFGYKTCRTGRRISCMRKIQNPWIFEHSCKTGTLRRFHRFNVGSSYCVIAAGRDNFLRNIVDLKNAGCVSVTCGFTYH